MKRSCLLSIFILIVLSILLLSGCSSHSPETGEPKEVTLGVWKSDAILPTVNAFNAQQEQFQIRLVIYDSLELMQTELMAGKYCDLYLLEMDNSAMAAKSLFVDLMPRVEETLNNTENEVVPELLDAMTVNGALMQIPYSFSIGTCMGLQQYFDGHGISLEDAKQALNDHARPIFPEEWKLKARNIASKVSSVSGIFFVDRSKEEVQFQKSEFDEYLKFWMDGWAVQQSQDMDSDLALFIPTFLGNPGEPPADGYVYTGYPTLTNMPAGSYFSFGTAFSIISGSKNVEEAWEFIRFCLSTEQQRSVREGMPVNSRVLQERIDERIESKEITETDAQCFYELLDETEWVRASPEITDIFSEEISACFEGNRQVEEAAKMIENRLNLFLAESREY
jgi:ABC-type glycerol-3-phosphate transport system substrate-binding protein